MPSLLRALAAASVCLVCLGVATPVAAQEAPPGDEKGAPDAAPAEPARMAASRRFKQGIQLYDEGDYTAALVEFRRAYELAPNYKVLYNIALANFQLGDYAAALTTLEQYLADGGEDVSPDRKADVEKEMAKLRKRVGTVTVVVNEPGATIRIDGEERGTSPLVAPVLVSIGKRKIEAVKGNRTTEKTVSVATGDAVRVELALAKAAVVPSPDPDKPDAPTTDNTSAIIVTWTATGLLTAGAVATGVLALSASSDLETLRETVGSTQVEREDKKSEVQRFAVATDVLAVAAGVMAGVSLYFTIDQAVADSASASGDGANGDSTSARGQWRFGVGPTNASVQYTW